MKEQAQRFNLSIKKTLVNDMTQESRADFLEIAVA